ncbi:MAG: hypothetical protein AAF533_06065 [Acidobacteriota bacterium]
MNHTAIDSRDRSSVTESPADRERTRRFTEVDDAAAATAQEVCELLGHLEGGAAVKAEGDALPEIGELLAATARARDLARRLREASGGGAGGELETQPLD